MCETSDDADAVVADEIGCLVDTLRESAVVRIGSCTKKRCCGDGNCAPRLIASS
jgi:hypothetical protein